MKTLTILKYQWEDLIRGKWIIGYSLIYLLISDALIRFGGAGPKAMLSIANIMLLLIPLVSLLYGALYLYQSREFTELMLAQPIPRSSVFKGLYGGVSVPLALAFSIGVLVPMFYSGMMVGDAISSILTILILGNVLTFLFSGLGFWIGLTYFDDRIKGLGFALVGWLILAVLFDGLLLLAIFVLGDYPIEKSMLALSLSNPIDLARIIVLLKFDISALMGYTGAVFNRFFGTLAGISVASLSLMFWTIVPLWRASRKFNRMDL